MHYLAFLTNFSYTVGMGIILRLSIGSSFLLPLIIGIVFLTGCGVKAPPVFPEAEALPADMVICSPYNADCDTSDPNYDPDFDGTAPDAVYKVPLPADAFDKYKKPKKKSRRRASKKSEDDKWDF